MIRTILPGALIALSLLAFLPPANGTDESPSVEKLIEQLGSPDFAIREKASQLLRARGPSALPALRKAMKHRDAEVRRRVQQLIPVLEIAAALEPKRVTLNAVRQPLAAILREIEKQTGYKVEADDVDDDRPYSFQMQGVTFWEALERIGTATGRAPGFSVREGGKELASGLGVRKAAGRSPLVALTGPFRVVLTNIHEDRDIDFTEPGAGNGAGKRDHQLTMTIQVQAEPRFVLRTAAKAQVDAALDENDKSLILAPKPKFRFAFDFTPLDGNWQKQANILLQRSSETARTIKVLRGTIAVKVVAVRKRVVVTEKLLESTGQAFQIGGKTLEVTKVTRNEGGDTRIDMQVPDENEDLAHWDQRVHVEDANGFSSYKMCFKQITSIGNGISYVRLEFRKAQDPNIGPPSRLIVEDWITLDYGIPFEFKDVPLP